MKNATMFMMLIFPSLACPALPFANISISTYGCGYLSSSQQTALYQRSDNLGWFYNTTSNNFINAYQQLYLKWPIQRAPKITMNSYFGLVQFNNYRIYYVQSYTLSTFNIGHVCSNIITYKLIIANGSPSAIFVCNTSINLIEFQNNRTASILNTLSYQTNATVLECLSRLCLVGNSNGQLIIFHSNNLSVIANQTLSSSKIQLLCGNDLPNGELQLFVLFEDGYISEYIFDHNWQIRTERSSQYFMNNFNVFMETVYQYLVLIDSNGLVTQISIYDGSIIKQTHTNISNPIVQRYNLTSLNFRFNSYSTIRISVNFLPGSSDQIILKCQTSQFFNDSQKSCKICGYACISCRPNSGNCIQCIPQYFNHNGSCLSCFYDPLGLTTYFNQCFSQSQKSVLQASSNVILFLSTLVSSFATILNLCGLLFLFFKLINNWTIICLYFFVEIKMPFYLQNVLKLINNNLNSSVLAAIGIQLSPSLGTQNRITSQNFVLASISTDFIVSYFEPIILFFYSVLLICTVYKLINYLLAKIEITLFQNNSTISIIQEFVGSFTFSLLSFFHIASNPYYSNTLDIINMALHFLFVSICLLVPFGLIIFSQEQKIVRNNKVHNNNEEAIAKILDKGAFKIISQWNSDDSREKLFYAILSFTSAIFASHPQPLFFLIGTGTVHLLSLISTLKCKQININNLIQKISFLLYHVLFSSLYFVFSEKSKLLISLVAVLLIIFISAHQLIVSVFRKMNVIWKIVRQKCEKRRKIDNFIQKNKAKMKERKRNHAKILPWKFKTNLTQFKSTSKTIEVKITKQKVKGILKNKQKSTKKLLVNRSKSKKNVQQMKKTNADASSGMTVSFKRTERIKRAYHDF